MISAMSSGLEAGKGAGGSFLPASCTSSYFWRVKPQDFRLFRLAAT